MAPQNSTLIDENADLESEQSEILSRFSPISKRSADINCEKDNIEDVSDDDEEANQDEIEIPIWICGEPRFISGINNTTTCNDIIQALIDDEVHNAHSKANPNSDVAASRDFRDYVITERWRDIEQALVGETCILPLWQAWGAARNEVKFKLKINRNGVETDCKVDKKRNKNKVKTHKKDKVNLIRRLIRRVIKQGETIQDHLSVLSDHALERGHSTNSLKLKNQKHPKRELLQTFLNDTNTFKQNHQPVPPEEDELFLVIENTDDDKDSGVHIYNTLPRNFKSKNSFSNRNSILRSSNMEPIKETPKRKGQNLTNCGRLVHQNLNQNYFHPKLMNLQVASSKKVSGPSSMSNAPEFQDVSLYARISAEISRKTEEMQKLLERKSALTKHLAKTCHKYKMENDRYKINDAVEFSVEKVQTNLQKYTEEIVRTEVELYRIRSEVQQKYSILTNLKRMLRSKEDVERQKPRHGFQLGTITPVRLNGSIRFKQKTTNYLESGQFVDNINEFCDNNASLIV